MTLPPVSPADASRAATEVWRDGERSSIVSTASNVSLQSPPVLDLRPGELVRVRSASEIFATLDERGMLDGLPFMPEMLKYCGRTLPVTQRADTTCAGAGVVRRMHNTVHLQKIRCDGSFHDGCQAACLMFWKEAWLERAESGAAGRSACRSTSDEQAFVDETLIPATKVTPDPERPGRATAARRPRSPAASEPMRFRELDQYVRGLPQLEAPKIVRGLADRGVQPLPGLQRPAPARRRLLIAGGQAVSRS